MSSSSICSETEARGTLWQSANNRLMLAIDKLKENTRELGKAISIDVGSISGGDLNVIIENALAPGKEKTIEPPCSFSITVSLITDLAKCSDLLLSYIYSMKEHSSSSCSSM